MGFYILNVAETNYILGD